jgi:hypothetical protein
MGDSFLNVIGTDEYGRTKIEKIPLCDGSTTFNLPDVGSSKG